MDKRWTKVTRLPVPRRIIEKLAIAQLKHMGETVPTGGITLQCPDLTEIENAENKLKTARTAEREARRDVDSPRRRYMDVHEEQELADHDADRAKRHLQKRETEAHQAKDELEAVRQRHIDEFITVEITETFESTGSRKIEPGE